MTKLPLNIKRSKLLKDYIGEAKGYIWNIQKLDDYYYRTEKKHGNWLATPITRKRYSEKIMQCRLYGWTLEELGKKLEEWKVPDSNN